MNLQFKSADKKFNTPYAKYLNIIIQESFTDTFPSMVRIGRAPAYAKHLIGKRYIDLEKAIKVIDAVYSEHLISKNRKTAYKDLVELGIESDSITEYVPIIPKIDYSQTVVSSSPID